MDTPSTNPCIKGMTVDTCPHNPRLGCDCGANPSQRALKGVCRAFWRQSGKPTEEWNGAGCRCPIIQGVYACRLNPF